jgi:hypothetical protein
VVDEQLRASVEELGQGLGPVVGLEAVLLLDRHPGKLPPLPREFVAATGELLLLREQLVSFRLPLLLRSHCGLGHRVYLLYLTSGPVCAGIVAPRRAPCELAPGDGGSKVSPGSPKRSAN